jgi:transcriptional regulator with XRE-family HTH domain
MTDAEDGGTYDQWVGENIAQIRRARGMTQAELAERIAEDGLPFHQQTVVKIEKGQRPVRLREADAITAALDVELGALLAERPVLDAVAMLIGATERVSTLRQELRDLNLAFMQALRWLDGQLDRVGGREGAPLPHSILDDAATLLKLSPVKVAEEAEIIRKAEVGKQAADEFEVNAGLPEERVATGKDRSDG